MTNSTLSPIQSVSVDLVQLNRQFDRAYPKEILAWCGMNLPTGLVQTSTFNLDDIVITDLLYRELRIAPRVPILFVDTLHHFRETLELVKYAQKLYNLNLKTYKIENVRSAKSFATKYGKAFWETDPEKFHYLTKIEPLQRGLQELETVAWITGRRRDRSPALSSLPVFEWDKQGRLKINPLANWTRTESWAYAYEHDMLYNPLHDCGYPCIGDEPLTPKVSNGDSSLSAWNLEQTENLIHAHL